jgi:Xaa-Pro dipeptidase
MVSTSTTAGVRRPQPATPRSVASADARKGWPEIDTGLALGALEWGLARTRAALRRHDIAAALLVDLVNIRDATGTSVMPVWTLHSIDRYLLVPAEGEPVLWEYPSAPAEVTSAGGSSATRPMTTT